MLIFGRSTYTYCFVYGDVLFYSTDVVEPSHTPKTFRYRTRIVKEARTRSRASDPQTSISSARSLAKSGLLLRAAGRTNKPRRVVDHTNNYCTVRAPPNAASVLGLPARQVSQKGRGESKRA